MPNTVTLLPRINGIGGPIDCKESVHSHVQTLKPDSYWLGKQDNLFLRHLAIYLLDKFFRGCNIYQNRHIPLPLGHQEVSDQAGKKSTQMMTEFVYGFETSNAYNEHLDWNPVANAFANFGFTQLDCDLYSGFQGEADAVSHNFFSQNELFQSELQVVEATKNLPNHLKRSSTARWMRIDFGPDSFPLSMNDFIAAIKLNEKQLGQVLSADEFNFLKEYCNILQNKSVENIDPLIKRIRVASLSVAVANQNAMLKLVNKNMYEYVVLQQQAAPASAAAYPGKFAPPAAPASAGSSNAPSLAENKKSLF